MLAAWQLMADWSVVRVTADGDLEQKKKKKDDEKEKKMKKGRVAKISDASDEEADGGGWEAVKGGITTLVVSECSATAYSLCCCLFVLSALNLHST